MKARPLAPILAVLALVLAASPAPAANINVESLELLTHGSFDETTGLFTMSSRVYFDMSFEGGDKFAGRLRMDFLSGDIQKALELAGSDATTPAQVQDKINNLTSMGFKTASVTAKRLFGTGLEATYFVGYLDSFCSGNDFMGLFGAPPFGTSLAGPMAYPAGVGGNAKLYYEGLDAVYGTGLKLGLAGPKQALYAYAYQDADLGSGLWTGAIRGLLDTGPLKVEGYLGASTGGLYGIYKAGLLFDFAPGSVGEFFAQVGIPRWDISSTLGVDNFYFLFEPRVNFASGSLALTVFYHPAWYRQKATTEQNALDFALNLKFGNLSTSGSQGGLKSLLAFRPLETNPLALDISPYYSAIAAGLEWDFKLDLRVFPAPSVWYGMFRPYVGVSTSF